MQSRVSHGPNILPYPHVDRVLWRTSLGVTFHAGVAAVELTKFLSILWPQFVAASFMHFVVTEPMVVKKVILSKHTFVACLPILLVQHGSPNHAWLPAQGAGNKALDFKPWYD